MDFLDLFLHSLEHPLLETVKMSPILFLAYLFMEWLEHKEGDKLTRFVNKSKNLGPLWGSVLGLMPQCGFSGAVAGMYTTGTVTAGTLIAVILATSDEMLPIMLGSKVSVFVIVYILALKFIIGTIAGFVTDFIIRKRHNKSETHIHEFCELENCSCKDGIWLSALKHTLKILIIIYIVSVLLHLVIGLVPGSVLETLLNFPVISQIVAALIGLVPNCAVSVTLTQLYINGSLGFSPLICGLLTNGGVGLLVLYRTNRDFKDNLIITLTVFSCGLIFGSIAGIFAK